MLPVPLEGGPRPETPGWAWHHTDMCTTGLDRTDVGRSGWPFAVLVAEQLLPSGHPADIRFLDRRTR